VSALLGLALVAPWSRAQSPEVSLPNGAFYQRVIEMDVKVMGGDVVLWRQYVDGRWQINPNWNPLRFGFDALDGTVRTIDRNGAVFNRSGNAWVFDKTTRIQAVTVSRLPAAPPAVPPAGIPGAGGQPLTSVSGYRWSDRAGNWIDYDDTGRVTAYGDRNDVRVWLQHDAAGKLRYALDHFGRAAMVFTWSGERLTQVQDAPSIVAGSSAPARTVSFEWDGTAPSARLMKAVDARGFATSYGYASGGLSTITDAEGRVRRIAYDASGRVASLREADDAETAYAYDYDQTRREHYVRITGPQAEAGRRIEEVWYNAEGRVVRRDVNGRTIATQKVDGRVHITTDPRGLSASIELDDFDNIVRVTHPDGSSRSAVYSPVHGRVLERTDELGVRTAFEYDAKGNLVRQTEAVGRAEQRVTEFTVDAYGNRASTTSPAQAYALPDGTAANVPEAVVRFEYDDLGNIVRVDLPERQFKTYRYDIQGNVVEAKDVSDRVWRDLYDAKGNLLSEANPLGERFAYEYDKVGNRIAQLDPRDKRHQFRLDSRDRVSSVIDPLGNSRRFEFTRAGQPSAEFDERGRLVTRVAYDPAGQPVRVLDGADNAITLSYGENGELAGPAPSRVQFPTHERRMRYDARDRITQDTLVMGAEGLVTAYEYDKRGRPTAITDADGLTRLFEYDGLGRVVRLTDALNNSVRFYYDHRNNLLAFRDRLGRVTRFVYDAANRLIEERRPLGQTTSFAYDGNGYLAEQVDPNGQRLVFTHDAMGQLLKTEVYAPLAPVASQTLTYTYDADGNLVAWSDGAVGGTLLYDDLGRKISETVNYGPFSLTHRYNYYPNGTLKSLVYPDGTEISYEYDLNGQLARVDIPSEGTITVADWNWLAPRRVVYPGGVVQEFEHDGLLNLKRLRVLNPAQGTAAELKNAYGKVFELKQRALDGKTTGFSYDMERHLTGADGDNGGLGSEAFQVDAAGNRVSDSRVAGIIEIDANDRVLRRGQTTYEYDANGNLIRRSEPGRTLVFRYDGFNRLIEVQDGVGGTLARYGYDPFDRRLWKEANGQRVYFVYAEEGLLAEANDRGEVVLQYGWRPDGELGTDPLFLNVRQAATTRYFYYQNDHLGAPIRLTDRDGRVVWRADYSAFGSAQVDAGLTTVTSNLRLPGQYFDAETGLHYNFRRIYDPQTGRYLTQDPVGISGGWNLYAYTQHNPLNEVDPTGEWVWVVINVALTVYDIYDTYRTIKEGDGCIDWVRLIVDRIPIMKIKWLRKLRKVCSTPCECLTGNSFTGDTLVHTDKGLRPIGEIAAGDRVLSVAEWLSAGEALSFRPVTEVISSTRSQELVRITLDTGAVITATAAHPMRTADGWRNAKLLQAGGQLDLKGRWEVPAQREDQRALATIVKVETLFAEQAVYNLEVANAHTYFIGEDGVLVHNGRRSARSVRREWERNTGKQWPTNPPNEPVRPGQPQDVSHIIPLCERGPDDWTNVEPKTPSDHVDHHKRNGDYKRWGGWSRGRR
jgi:RHS repeat-associated protein